MSRVLDRVFRLLLVGAAIAWSGDARADEADALAISRHIRESHTPFGLLFDAVYTGPGSRERMGYMGYGDSALWTGMLLAADAYQYSVTRSPEALASATRSLQAIDRLSRVSGDGLLARYFYPVNDPYVGFFKQDRAGAEYHQAVIDGQPVFYVTRTSRDQYAGIFFGLGAAYDLIDDAEVKAQCQTIITRLVDHLVSHHWHIYRRDGTIHDTFLHRPEQRLSILQLAAHVDPARFAAAYRSQRRKHSRFAWFGVLIDVLDVNSAYYKFNLDHLYFYTLLRLEPRGTVSYAQYGKAYTRMREAVRDHGNAHFNMIDRALTGPAAERDRETVALLEQWLTRGLRQKTVDSRGTAAACGTNRACTPLPVAARAYTDFLWQRDPFRLYQPGDERIEHSGLDYILPYWMARYYGVITR